MIKRKAKYSEIKVFYKFKPSLDIWFSKNNGKSVFTKLPDETWYGGFWFNSGYFIFLQCRYFAIHIMFKYWKFKSDIFK